MTGVNFVSSDAGVFLRSDYSRNCALDSSTVYVFPDVVCVAEARRFLLNGLRAVNGRQFLTPESLASMIVRGVTAGQAQPLPDSLLEIMARDVLKSLRKQGWQLPLSFSDAILRDYTAVRQFYAAGRKWLSEIVAGSGTVPPDDTVARRVQYIEEFSALFEDRLNKAEQKGFLDRNRLIRIASENPDFLRGAGIDRVVFLFLTYADAAIISFIEALATRAEVVIVLDGDMQKLEPVKSLLSALDPKHAVDDAPSENGKAVVTFFGAPDMRRELTEVARRIRSEIAAGGVAESDFAVLARNIADYDTTAREIFDGYDIRVDGGRKRTVADTALFEFVMRFLRCFDQDASGKDMRRLIMHELSPAGRQESRAVSEMLELMPEYIEAWSNAPDTLKRTKRRALRSLDTSFIESVLKLRSATGRKITFPAWMQMLTKVASLARTDAQDSADAGRFIQAIREMSGLSTPIAAAISEGEMSLSEFTTFLERFCSAETLGAPMRGKGVLLTDAGIVYLRKFRHCFILGMNDGVFPAEPVEGAFLAQSVIDAMSRSGFMTRRSTAYHSSTESYYYRRAKNLSGETTLSYLTSDSEGRKMLPSQFIIEDCAGNVDAGERLEMLDRGSIPAAHFFPDEGEKVLSKGEMRMILADGLRQNSSLLTNDEKRELWRNCNLPEESVFMNALRRMNGAPLPWELSGENPAGKLLASRLSASDLNEYAACPFRFYLKRVLKLHPPEAVFGYRSRGTDAHEILKSYFSERKLEEFRKESDESISAEVDRKVAEHYSKEYGEQCMTDLVAVLGMDTLASVLKEFLQKERAIQVPLSTDILMIEKSFGFEGAPLKIGEYEFRGKIDRVDALRRGSSDVVLFDYKFTKPGKLRLKHFNSETERPLNFELPVYSLYLKDVLGHSIAGALYYSLQKSGGKFDRAGLVEESKAVYFIPDLPKRKSTQISVLSANGMEEIFEKYRTSVTEIAGNIRAGRFTVTPEKGECENCGFMAFCRNWGGSAD